MYRGKIAVLRIARVEGRVGHTSASMAELRHDEEDLMHTTMERIGSPPDAPPEPSAEPPNDIMHHLETHGYCPLGVHAAYKH